MILHSAPYNVNFQNLSRGSTPLNKMVTGAKIKQKLHLQMYDNCSQMFLNMCSV